MKPKAVIPVLVVGALLLGASAAQAGRWSFGNGESDLEVALAPVGNPFSVCTNRIHGRAGLGTTEDPAVTPPQAPPYPTQHIEVYTGSELGAAQVDQHGNLVLDGVTLTPIATQTTAPPTALNPPEQYTGFSDQDLIWEYAAAPFSFSFAPGQIQPGDDVIIRNASKPAFVIRTAQSCPAQPVWRGQTWNHTGTGNVTASQTAKQLSFTLTGGGSVDPVGTYATDCTVSGYADAHVHYKVGPWPAHNGVHVGLLVNNPDYPFPPTSVTAERTSYAASGDVATGEKYAMNAADVGGGLVKKSTSQTEGDLRARVKNGTIHTYYRDATTAGVWRSIGKSPDYTGSVSFALQVWSSQALFTGQTTTVKFSKFAITKGVCA